MDVRANHCWVLASTGKGPSILRFRIATVTATMILTACGGLPDVGDAVDGGNPFEDLEDAFDPDPVDISGLGDPPTAEPGTAVVAFDDQSVVYRMVGSVNPRCEVTDERFQVSMEDADGNLFIFDGTPADGETGWQGSPAFDVDRLHHEGNALSGHVNVDGDVITYQGTITIFLDRSDINSWEDTLGSVTANCSRPNGLPTATIDGETFEIPVSGASGFECEFSDDRFNFDVEYRTFDKYPDGNFANERITVDGRLEGERWIGGILVRLGPDEYRGFIPEDLAGLEVGPEGARWSGTLTHINAADDSVEEDVEILIAFVC